MRRPVALRSEPCARRNDHRYQIDGGYDDHVADARYVFPIPTLGASNAERLGMTGPITERDVLDIVGEVDPLGRHPCH